MSEKELQPEIMRFKEFINRHPNLIKEIRKNGRSWQDVYEQWTILGPEDIHWEQYKDSTEENKSSAGQESFKLDLKPELIKQVIKYAETLDINKLQDQVQQLSKTISTVQEIVGQYQSSGKRPQERERPFSWIHD
ncbi:spore coat protein YlbD [Oceanobacillus sp. CAU 1775]